ncbi:MAG: nitrophenyl compound nitroreductase subunit ArsF family protein [archaeon]
MIQETNQVSDAKTTESSVQKIEVFHFHRTQQCYSCKTVGAYAEETVKTYFRDDLNTGKIVFDHINAELPENKERTIKYGATGSSLWIGVYRADGSFSKEENTNVWYKIKDKQDYMNYLKQVLEQKLKGN